jgi:PII-like signaling protein
MVTSGPAKRLTIYVDEIDKVRGKPVYEAILDFLYKNGISGASVFRGVAGYGGDGVVHRAKILELSDNLPLKIEVLESAAKLEPLMPELLQMVGKGLIEVSDTNILKVTGKD